jgi:hypothetical protein
LTYTSKINWKEELSTIKLMGAKGATFKHIADHYKVSRQRLHQVINKYIPEWNDEYGGVVRRRDVAVKWYSKWGEKSTTKLYQMQRLKFSRKKANAMRVGYTWTVEFGELIWPTHCPILDIELDYFAETRQENSPSFDRIDSSKGYDKGNVIVVSWRANRIKNDGSADEHKKIANYLYSLQ